MRTANWKISFSTKKEYLKGLNGTLWRKLNALLVFFFAMQIWSHEHSTREDKGCATYELCDQESPSGN
ncbi:hypothetical protein A0J61_06663 [Choanephora cucurbitarum]|uniref:Uncharacterized protein n=1 Tax=Choanephora cucurbitarum TaxID=101091 RepID=A0A1C7N9I0_9FUNG|nr:hypothetical protein A0J61_06663 [Choanephora cucurbitarum]